MLTEAQEEGSIDRIDNRINYADHQEEKRHGRREKSFIYPTIKLALTTQ